MDWNLTSFLPSYRNCIWKQFSARPKFKQRYAWGSRVGFSDHSVWENCPEAGPGQCGSGYIKSYPHHSNCPYWGLLPEDSAAGQMLPPAGRRHGQERVYAGRVPGGPSAHPCPDSEGSWASSWFRRQGKGTGPLQDSLVSGSSPARRRKGQEATWVFELYATVSILPYTLDNVVSYRTETKNCRTVRVYGRFGLCSEEY